MTSLGTAMMRQTAAGVEASLDDARVNRFRSLLEGPLAIVASGGSYTTALLWAHLHEVAGNPAWAVTPYAFAQRTLPPGTRVLLLSASGNHHDILAGAARALERGHETRAVVYRADSRLASLVGQASEPDAVFAVGDPPYPDDMIAVQSVVAFAVLAGRTYAGRGPWAPYFDCDAELPTRVPRFVIAFGAGAAEPAAVDFVNKCHETGLAPAWHTDLRHFSHGQFMMLRGGGDDPLLLAFATASQRDYVKRFAAVLPPTACLHRIEVDAEGAPAALSLLARSMRSFAPIIERAGGPPTLATLPAWGRSVYELEP